MEEKFTNDTDYPCVEQEIWGLLPLSEDHRSEQLGVSTHRQRYTEIKQEIDIISASPKDVKNGFVTDMREEQKEAFDKTLAEIKEQIKVEQAEIASLDQALEDVKKQREKLVVKKQREYDQIAKDALNRRKKDVEQEESETQELRDRKECLEAERDEIREQCRRVQEETENLKAEWAKERKRLAQEQRRLNDDEQSIKQREERIENQRREQMRSVASQELELLKKQEALNLLKKDIEARESELSKRKNIVINEENGRATLGDAGRQLDI